MTSEPLRQASLFVETPEDLFRRVYRDLRPRSRLPDIRVRFCEFANADSFARLHEGVLEVRISDLLEKAPAPVHEALAYILLSKLLGRPVPRIYAHRYRVHLNRRDVRRSLHLVRQLRGRKFISGPQGEYYNLEEIFEELNARYFHGLMARPGLGWSRRPSRTTLGHYDPSHNAIIISKLLDRPVVPRLAVEYVLFHEMLHLRFPAQSRGARRSVHPPEFRQAERAYPALREAKQLLKDL